MTAWWATCPHTGCSSTFATPMHRELHLSGVHRAWVTDDGRVYDQGQCPEPECTCRGDIDHD